MDIGWFIIRNNLISINAIRSKMKKFIEALRELCHVYLYEVNVNFDLTNDDGLSIMSIPEECVIHVNETIVIMLFDNLKNFPLPSQSIIGGLKCITSHDILLLQKDSHI